MEIITFVVHGTKDPVGGGGVGKAGPAPSCPLPTPRKRDLAAGFQPTRLEFKSELYPGRPEVSSRESEAAVQKFRPGSLL